jgi:hypothetical protein
LSSSTSWASSSTSSVQCPTDASLAWLFYGGSAWSTLPITVSCACACDHIAVRGVENAQPDAMTLFSSSGVRFGATSAAYTAPNGHVLFYSASESRWIVGVSTGITGNDALIRSDVTSLQCPELISSWSYRATNGAHVQDPALTAQCACPCERVRYDDGRGIRRTVSNLSRCHLGSHRTSKRDVVAVGRPLVRGHLRVVPNELSRRRLGVELLLPRCCGELLLLRVCLPARLFDWRARLCRHGLAVLQPACLQHLQRRLAHLRRFTASLACGTGCFIRRRQLGVCVCDNAQRASVVVLPNRCVGVGGSRRLELGSGVCRCCVCARSRLAKPVASQPAAAAAPRTWRFRPL